MGKKDAMKKLLTLLMIALAFAAGAQDGSLDPTFNIGTGADQNVYAIQQLPDGKILIGGQFAQYDGQPANMLARLNADGSLDTTWNPEYTGGGVGTIIPEENGKIVIGELFGGIKRLNADGSLDATFSAQYNFGYDNTFVARQGSKYIISGVFNIFSGEGFYRNIMRLNADGSIDTTFPPTELMGTYARAYVIEDKILVVGTTQYYNGEPIDGMFMLDANGGLDNSFSPVQGSGNGGIIRCMAVQPDGKFVIGGTFQMINGQDRSFVARLNIDGTLDDSFIPPAGDGIQTYHIAVQPDYQILTSGWFAQVNPDIENPGEVEEFYMRRFNADGSVDGSFAGGGFGNPVNHFSFQDDGKILVGGWFTDFNGEPQNRVARLTNESLGTPGINPSQTFSLYPNPVSDRLYVSHTGAAALSVSVYDVSGKVVYTANALTPGTAINTEYLARGLYMVQISDGTSTERVKIIKG